MTALHVVDHPAAALQLARLRDAATPPAAFREAARRLGVHLTSAALQLVPVDASTVTSPLGEAPTTVLRHPVVAVPVLRAGLGLLAGVTDVLDDVRVGMIGLARDHDTHEPERYYRNVPPLGGAWVLLLEPMLATGGSAAAAVAELDAGGAAGVTVVSVVATQQAIEHVGAHLPDGGAVVTAAVDPVLDDDAYIVPGLGDFGDRLFDT